MVKKIGLLLFVLAVIIFSSGINAKTKPQVSGVAAILMDAQTGQVLYSKNALAIMAPASTTKIMTGILAIENGNLNKPVTVSALAGSREGSSMKLAANQQLSLQNLLNGLLLVSGNDAATAIAEFISGNETKFATLMNEKAKILGMRNTHFLNASGLPEIGHYTTAYDMALLTKYALRNPVFAEIVRKKKATVDGKPGETLSLTNHNKLLWNYPYATGVKTGYTANAGGCLVASAERNNRTLIAVVLKSGCIYNDCIKLFNYGFGLR